MFLQSYSVPVKDVMSREYRFVKEGENISTVIDFLTKNIKKEVLVCDNRDKLVGIITSGDIYRIMGKDFSAIPIREIMKPDVIFIEPNESLSNCRSIMLNNGIGRLPIISDGKIVGIIREEHIRDYFYKGVEEAELALKHIFDNIHEAICVVDNKNRVIIWNKNAERLYGVSEEELKGKYLVDYFPDAIDLKISQTRESVKNIYYSPKEGYHVIISASPIIIDDKLYGVVSTEKDISEVEELHKELKKAKERVEILEKQIKGYSEDPFDRIIGSSRKIGEKINIAKQIAKTNASILITGESGTGKEEFAKAIHKYSEVKGSFVPVNCSAIPSELFESEFFGYEKGAFTGARNEGKTGFFEQANEGTLFLDEIGDLPLSMQAKLLRVLQDKKIKKVGGEKYIPLNVRIISATNKDLIQMAEEEQFREELYYRINVIEIKLPPLRERKEDIVLLVDYFLKEICSDNNKSVPNIDKEVMELLLDYEWKGNIRELKNVVEYMAIMCKSHTVTKDLLPKYIFADSILEYPRGYTDLMDLNQSVNNLEINLIKRALNMAKGNKQEAAALLNIPRTTLHSKMKKYNLYD